MSAVIAALGLCAIYKSSLTYPPAGQTIQGNYFSVYNIDRSACPPINADTEVIFNLYTRNNHDSSNLLKTDNDTLLNSSGIDFKKNTKIFFHGFLESSNSVDGQSFKNATLENEDSNVILVNAKLLLAGPNYLTAVNNVIPIGKFAAQFVDYLVSKGMDLDKFEVVGHSLGGQITGILGGNVKSGKIRKIVAYDPAGPSFNDKGVDERLDAGDADQVIVIHTSPKAFGFSTPCGTIDFWVNGDPLIQPGCATVNQTITNIFRPADNVFCSHHLSFQAGVYSINHPDAFPGQKCATFDDCKNGKYDDNAVVNMNNDVPTSTTGNYYVKISADTFKQLGFSKI